MVSVRKRGKVYEYRIEIASIDGTRKWLTKSGFKTKQEALHEGALAYNEYYYYGKKNKNRDMSFADYLDYWIDNYCNFNLKYATIVTYLNINKVHLKPKLGMYKLSQIDSELIQNFINQLYVEHNYSKCYLKGILKAIKGALKYACYDVNFINHNPAEHVHIPRYEVVTGDPAHIYTQEEIERILDRFKDLPYIYYSFLTAYYTGLRVSEVYGLTWDNIDFENKTLTVDKNIIRKNKEGLPKRYNIAKGHSTETWYYGSCKNSQSRRTIAIGDTLIKALINYKNRQDYLKEIFGTQYKYYHLEDDNVDKRIVINNNNEVKIQLLEARYVDTSNISLVNSRVGDSLTKVFYVKNITDNDLYYNINLVDVANSFVNKEELVFSLKSDNGAYINEKVVPSANTTIASYVKIGKNEEHKYVLNIDFLNTGKDQFENELKTFFAKLNIVTSSDVFETYSENSLYKIIENSSYGNEGLIYGDTTMSGLVFSTNTTTNGETVYIYRGSREINNNLVVADKCYKIISTNDSFDVKAIYNGNFIDGKCNDNNVLVEKSNQFNKNSNYNAYVGYMYGSASSGDYVNEHANMSSSSIKIFLDSWYNTNLSDYSNYISNNGGYCANRKTAEFNYNKVDFDKNGFGNSNSGYTPMNRYLNNSYSLICEYENDRFSVLEMYGNGELSNSIGLITLDELFYTGFLKDPKNNYLYTNDLYWTMSPAYFLNGNAYNFVVNKNNITQLNVSKESGIRPVITLKGNIDVLEGNGSIDNPYVITK